MRKPITETFGLSFVGELIKTFYTSPISMSAWPSLLQTVPYTRILEEDRPTTCGKIENTSSNMNRIYR